MYGEDSCGRKVSLLSDAPSINNNTTTTFPYHKLPSRSRISTSSQSSCASRDGRCSSRSSSSGSPRHSHSPPTPPLTRLDSQSSLNTQSTHSPMTPQYGFESMEQHMKREQNIPPYFSQQLPRQNGYPSMQDATSQPYFNLSNQQPLHGLNEFNLMPDNHTTYNQRTATTLQPLQTQLQNYAHDHLAQHIPAADPYTQAPSSTTSVHHTNTHTPQTSLPPLSATTSIKPDPATPITPSTSTSTASAANKPPTNKKKYPCPHAQRFACTDTFTTSGHAARHGKKHTGEKNILCPTCNKAFTRKDNMKQHERTHKGGTSRQGSTAASPVISSTATAEPSRKGSIGMGDAMDVDDEAGPIPHATSRAATAPAMSTSSSARGGLQRPKLPRSELSEILESMDQSNQNNRLGRVGGVGGGGTLGGGSEEDADGEGESPGLDALATAASGMS